MKNSFHTALLSQKQILLSDLQSFGLCIEQGTDDNMLRLGGAGPTDHRAITVLGSTVMVRIIRSDVKNQIKTPFIARRKSDFENSMMLFKEQEELAPLEFPPAPRFYSKKTEEGIPYWKIARLHSNNVLATTVMQTCIRYGNRKTKCQFCAIGESLKHQTTIARKSPEQLAEVALAAQQLDGVSNVVMTTGTPVTSDRGAAILVECARAIKRATGLPIQVQCEPPDDFMWFRLLKDAGVDSLGMHLEAWDQSVREHIMPGKSEVSVGTYLRAFKKAVEVFGRGEVSTYLLAGLGDTKEGLLLGCRKLVDLGVYPFVVPFVPVGGTQFADCFSPSPAFMRSILEPLAAMLTEAKMTSDSLKAGCAKCAACSTLSLFEQTKRTSLKEKPAVLSCN
ncbi:MAG: MSMEG_0568 family radical SAM protein [Verrucomicrobiota bacterium]